jgi:hypothetical protein
MGLFCHHARGHRARAGLALLAAAPAPARRPRWRRAGTGAAAAALLFTAACSAGGGSAGGRPASTPAGPGQVLLAAATQAQQVTSATETLAVTTSGASSSAVTGTIRIRLKPALLASEDLTVTAAGASTRVKAIIDGTDLYLNEASLAGQFGKPWVKMDLSALPSLAGPGGAGLAKLVQSLQGSTFTSQAQLVTVAKDTRVVGTQVAGGVPTTEYAGSFTAAQGLQALPASVRQALAPGLRALGNTTIAFREWIDGQQHLRKMTEAETVNGATITTTITITAINQPVTVTLPPASQTFLIQGSSPGGGNPPRGDLGAKVVAAPPGFALSSNPGEPSGPMNAAGFNTYMGAGNLAGSLGFTRGYDVFYDGPGGDVIEVTLFQFATGNDATAFKAGWVPGGPASSTADPAIPGAEDFDSTTVIQGGADHGVIAVKGNTAFVIDNVTPTTTPVPLVRAMARQQYAAL